MALKLKAKPTPPKTEAKSSRLDTKAGLSRFPLRDLGVVRLIRDIRSELRKVVWPTRLETQNLTIIVVAVSAAVGIFLGGVDFIFQKLFEFLISAF